MMKNKMATHDMDMFTIGLLSLMVIHIGLSSVDTFVLFTGYMAFYGCGILLFRSYYWAGRLGLYLKRRYNKRNS